MTQQPEYKTRKDGSIDYAFYLKRSHQIRSEDTFKRLKAFKRVFLSLRNIRVRILRNTSAPTIGLPSRV